MEKTSAHFEIPESVLKRWWWRRLVFVKFEEQTHTTSWRQYVPEMSSYGFSHEWNSWHKTDELTAYRYELLRRTSFTTLPEWPALPGWLEGFVRGIIAPKPERSVCAMFAPYAPEGYASLDWMWDLTASDEALCKRFILMINGERQKIGLPSTDDPFSKILGKLPKQSEKRRGKRNRQVSWLAIEAHDIQSYGLRPLTDGERSRLSKARREIKEFEEPLKKALESAEQIMPPGKRADSGEPLCARFIRENFIQRTASRIQKQ